MVNACSSGGTTPAAATIKVAGGGQIQVPDVNSPGTASFGFNAGTGDGGHFNYVNHVNNLHVDGTVNDIAVIAFNPDGSPKTVLFSGTCGAASPGTSRFSLHWPNSSAACRSWERNSATSETTPGSMRVTS
jgi:hypothetical protein